MQMSGGHLLAAGLDGGNTIIFAKGENANESLIHPFSMCSYPTFAKGFCMGWIMGFEEAGPYTHPDISPILL